MDLIDPFYQIGKEYKHIGYPQEVFILKEFSGRYAVFKVSHGHYLVPYHKQHIFMYKRINSHSPSLVNGTPFGAEKNVGSNPT